MCVTARYILHVCGCTAQFRRVYSKHQQIHDCVCTYARTRLAIEKFGSVTRGFGVEIALQFHSFFCLYVCEKIFFSVPNSLRNASKVHTTATITQSIHMLMKEGNENEGQLNTCHWPFAKWQ